jgi:hypothetical protein
MSNAFCAYGSLQTRGIAKDNPALFSGGTGRLRETCVQNLGKWMASAHVSEKTRAKRRVEGN